MTTPRDSGSTAGVGERLAALDAYAILDTPAETGFDDIVTLAADICDTPTALVSLIDRDRQWFKARTGFAPCETGLSQSVCAHALAQDDVLVITDLAVHPLTRENTLVTGEHHLRFYAGAVLKTPGGVAFGSLCVIDTVPRPGGLTERQRDALRALARQVVALLELRRAIADRDAALATRATAEAVLQRDADRHAGLLALQGAIGAASGNLDAILDAAVTAALRVIPATEGAVIEMRDGAELVYAATAGQLGPFLGFRVPISGSLSGRSLTEGRSLTTGDAEADARVDAATARRLGIRSMVVAPIARLGEFFAVLKVQSGQKDAFAAHDLRSAELLAAAVAAGFGDAAETRSLRELRASEAMLRRAGEAAAIGTFSTDIARRATVASDGFFRLFGLEPMPELPTALWETLLVDEDRADTAGHLHGAPKSDASYTEYRIRRADTGEMRWIARSGDYVRDADGGIVGLIGIAQDVSERRWDETRRTLLLDLDDRFKGLDEPEAVMGLAVEALAAQLDVARVGYAETDASGTRSTLTRLWSRNTEPEGVFAPTRLDDFGPRLIAELRDGRAVMSGDLRDDPRADAVAVATHAALGVVATLAVPVTENGRMLAIMFAHHDAPRRWGAHEVRLMTEVATRTREAVERTRAEVALKRSEARLLLAQEVGGIGTFEVPFDRDELEASTQMFRLYGLPERQRCSTRYFTDLVVEEDRALVFTPERRRDPTTPRVAEYRIRRADDGALRWMRRVSRAVESRGLATRLVGVVQDVTDRKLAEMALSAARDAAESANRAKSNFLANMSHELRTPLSAVIGYSEMIEEELADLGHREVLADVGKVKSNARHLLGLINDVLDLSKVEAGRMDVTAEAVDVAALAAEVASTVETLVRRRGNRLVLDVAADAGAMRTDGVKVRQCLLNLLSNASKFTEGGEVRLGVSRRGAALEFRVSDTGIGMTEDQVGRLFQRFTQADETTTRRFGGTGLGLALTRAFADLLGGTVTVDSAFGAGTTFTLTLPQTLPPRPAAH